MIGFPPPTPAHPGVALTDHEGYIQLQANGLIAATHALVEAIIAAAPANALVAEKRAIYDTVKHGLSNEVAGLDNDIGG